MLTIGDDAEFPRFDSRQSGVQSPHYVTNKQAAVRMLGRILSRSFNAI